MLIAEFYSKTTKIPPTLVICALVNGQRAAERQTHTVADKLEARAIARRMGATPWNF